MQTERAHLAKRPTAGLRRLQREHLTALLRPDGNPIRDRRTQKLFHRPGFAAATGQIAILRFPLRQSPPFDVAAEAQAKLNKFLIVVQLDHRPGTEHWDAGNGVLELEQTGFGEIGLVFAEAPS